MNAEVQPYAVRWELLLWPSVAIFFLLLVFPQGLFIWNSFHEDLGMGRISAFLTLDNYVDILTDPFYLRAFWVTFYLSVGSTVVGLLVAFPTAYLLARMRSRWISYLIALLLISSFVTVLIKLIGLTVIMSQQGMVNNLLMWTGLISTPLQMLHNDFAVLVGLVQYTLPLLVMLLFSVIQTIPKSLEDAAEVHGATRLSMFWRVLLPLAKPGLIAAALISFNMAMGAFTSAVILGGGRVLTLPVLIQLKVTADFDYAFGATLSTVLLVTVFVINLTVATYLMRGVRVRRSGL